MKTYEVTDLSLDNDGLYGEIDYNGHSYSFSPTYDCTNNYTINDEEFPLSDQEYDALTASLSEHLEEVYQELHDEFELSGWYYGNIFIDEGQHLTEEQYKEYFDPGMISYNMAKGIIEEGSKTGEAIDLKALQDDLIDYIKKQAIDNDYISINNGDLNLTLNCKCTLNGFDVDFRDLSEVSQEKLINDFGNACKQGEICELCSDIYDVMEQYHIDQEQALNMVGIDLNDSLYTAEIDVPEKGIDELLKDAEEKMEQNTKNTDVREYER